MNELYSNEKILLGKVASGDRAAFNQLYAAHIDNIFNYIYLFTKSRIVTEEILQDTFVSVWENKGRLAEITSFKHYIFRAVKNRLINHIRHEKIKNRVLYEIGQNADAMHETPDYEVTYKEYYRIIQDAINMLSPKRKMIFKLNIEEGISFDQIAEQLKISKSVVKKQFYKARDFVRQYLYEKGEILFILLAYSIIF